MYMNKFSARIENGKEDHSGYVKLKHKQQYSIVMRNEWDEPCNVRVKIDGMDIGEGSFFRIEGRGSLRLSRPVNDDGQFTFFRSDSIEGEMSGVANVDIGERGLIEVQFTPGSQRIARVKPKAYAGSSPVEKWEYTGGTRFSSYSGASMASEGITGLSSQSDQQFFTTHQIDLDYSRQTTITLRLVEDLNGSQVDARPVIARGNPVPPPI